MYTPIVSERLNHERMERKNTASKVSQRERANQSRPVALIAKEFCKAVWSVGEISRKKNRVSSHFRHRALSKQCNPHPHDYDKQTRKNRAYQKETREQSRSQLIVPEPSQICEKNPSVCMSFNRLQHITEVRSFGTTDSIID